MPTTSNFGWTTPADTDLVKDGALAIRTLGNGIDTSLVDLKGGTTGQILSKASNTDLDYTWINNDQGDITGVTAGTGISGGGTSGTVTITNSMATEITAAGDIIVGTGSGTFDNLPIGTTGQVLTADTTVSPYKVKWASAAAGGGMTLINTGGTTLSGATTTVSSIPGTYRNLYFVILNYKPATDDARLYVRANADATANRYYNVNTATGDAGSIGYNDSTWTLTLGNDNSVAQGLSAFTIYEYANTSIWKMIQGWSMQNNATSSANVSYRSLIGFYNQTGAITSLEFWNSTGNFTSGTVYVYGVQ